MQTWISLLHVDYLSRKLNTSAHVRTCHQNFKLYEALSEADFVIDFDCASSSSLVNQILWLQGTY